MCWRLFRRYARETKIWITYIHLWINIFILFFFLFLDTCHVTHYSQYVLDIMATIGKQGEKENKASNYYNPYWCLTSLKCTNFRKVHVPSIIIKIYIILSNPSHCVTDMNIAINISFISCIDVACHLVSILESLLSCIIL